MSIDIQEFKYKGVSIPFVSAPTSGGHRLVKYLYPGSDKQSVEIQGRAPRLFQIVGVIPHDDYYNIRDSIIDVLEDGKKGVLIHPTFGEVDNVVCAAWTIDESIQDAGRAEIKISFEIDDAKGTPEQVFNVKSIIENSVSDTMQSIESAISEHVDIATIRAGIDIAGQIVDSARDAVAFATKVDVALESPALFASSFGGVFSDIYGVYDDADQAFNAFNRLFGFGNDIEPVRPVNEGAIKQKKNIEVMVPAVKSAALAYAYLSAIDIDYSTAEEVATAHKKLEQQYLSVREYEESENFDIIAPDILNKLDAVRIDTIKMLDNIAVALPHIFAIDVSTSTPLSVLLYSYYGDTELFDVIADLNGVRDNAFIQGEFKMLSI